MPYALRPLSSVFFIAHAVHVTGLACAVLLASVSGVFAPAAFAKDGSVQATYTAYALGLPLVTLQVDIQQAQDRYAVGLETKTTGLGRIKQFSYQAQAQGGLLGGHVQPLTFLQHESSVKRGETSARSVQLQYDTAQQPTTLYDHEVKFRPGEEISPQDAAGSFDPASFLLAIARAVSSSGQCRAQGRLYDGRSLLELRFDDHGQDSVKTQGYNGPALYCVGHPQPVQGKATRPDQRDYYTPFEIWVAQPLDAAPALPVRLRSSFFIIPTTLELTDIKQL